MKTLKPISFLRFSFYFSILACLISCSSSNEKSENEGMDESSNSIEVKVEVKTSSPYTVFKMYKIGSKGLFSEPRGIEIELEFQKLYDANDVKVVGSWLKADDPSVLYFITAYHSMDHYEDFVGKMKGNKKYQELSLELEEDRTSIEVVDLVSLEAK